MITARRVVAASAGTVVLAALFGEAALRALSFAPVVRDVATSQEVTTDLWPRATRPVPGTAGIAPDAPVSRWFLLFPRCLKPDLRVARRFWGTPWSFTTRPCPNAEMGYRSNGVADDSARAYGVVVGDSITEGAQVDDAQNYVSLLSRMTRRRFVNLGAFAQGTSGHVERLRASGFLRLRPRVVILQLQHNDVGEDLRLEAARGRPDPAPLEGRWWLRCARASRLCFVFAGAWESWRRPYDPPPQSDAERRTGLAIQRKNLARFRALARASGARLLIVEDGDVGEDFDRLARAAGDPCLRLETSARRRLRLDGHWNPAGHQSAAAAIALKLLRLGWL